VIFWDVRCDPCNTEIIDLPFRNGVPDRLIHLECGNEMRLFTKKSFLGVVEEKDAAVVFRRVSDGKYIYPGSNRKRTPAGCERIVMRSVRELEKHYERTGAMSEVVAYDRNSGRGLDDSEG
jgi:hypothetical protein